MSTTNVNCAICGGTRTRRLYTKSGYDIARCVGCGLVYGNPRAPREAILARYSSDYFRNEYLPALGVLDDKYDLEQFDARYAPLLELLRPAPGRHLFEVGCGAGFFLKSAERAGWSVQGIELSEDGCGFARDRLTLDVRQEAAETMTVASAAFDAAVMFDTIEHLFDPRAVLTAIAQTLSPEGLLLVSTPNFRALSRHLLGSSWAVLSPLEHMYYFDEDTLGRLVEACGFTEVRFIREHAAWNPQETMNFSYTHAAGGARQRLAAFIGRSGGRWLARGIQRAGRQDILLCVARRSAHSTKSSAWGGER